MIDNDIMVDMCLKTQLFRNFQAGNFKSLLFLGPMSISYCICMGYYIYIYIICTSTYMI